MSDAMTATMGRGVLASVWHHRQLLRMMVVRDVAARYRGSVMGVAWSLVNPVLMLAVYTFVFSVVFNARWGTGVERHADFAVLLFVGLLIHAFFAECLTRAPALIVGHANLVKRVVFPLEVLPLSLVCSAMFNCCINVLVLLAAMLLFETPIRWTILLCPITLAPVVFYAVGTSFFLTSLGVFLRDIVQLTGMLSTLLLFMAPVFYPQDALPAAFRPWLNLNPLTSVIETTRAVLIHGVMPDWGAVGLSLLVSLVCAGVGVWWFGRTRKGFADVL